MFYTKDPVSVVLCGGSKKSLVPSQEDAARI